MGAVIKPRAPPATLQAAEFDSIRKVDRVNILPQLFFRNHPPLCVVIIIIMIIKLIYIAFFTDKYLYKSNYQR